tara:strand:+ start:4897 stop:5106 length:210 start_codon:yes stop_codon:yes gene_type:complete
MRIELSRHALEQARERGISINEIKRTIERGTKHLQESNKIIADYAHIRIVYKIIEKINYIITVMIRIPR